jgi:plastocyanin
MTWLSRICFSLLATLPAVAASVAGTVRLVDSTDAAVRRGGDYSGVVVWLEKAAGAANVPPARPAATAQMVQKDKRFLPHVLAVRVGTPVEFPNYDPIFHNAFSSFSGQIFDVGLYPPQTSRTVVFKRSGIVRVFCNIHPTMSAIIAVLDSPWFAVSGRSGAFTIQDVPPGEYRVQVFHERATESTLKALERKVTLTAGDLALPAFTISETGFVVTPHKNKYGKDYPPVADDNILYPGSRE